MNGTAGSTAVTGAAGALVTGWHIFLSFILFFIIAVNRLIYIIAILANDISYPINCGGGRAGQMDVLIADKAFVITIHHLLAGSTWFYHLRAILWCT